MQLSTLVVAEPWLRDLRFVNCHIVGPGILLLLNGITMETITLDAPIPAIFWEVPATRDTVVGAIGVERCEFYSCRFDGVGFAGPAVLEELLQQASTVL